MLKPETDLCVFSLSGGGYRAALYNAGVLRSAYEANLFASSSLTTTIVNAVSGGALPTALWDIYLRRDEEFRSSNPLWPEEQLLELVQNTPKTFGRWNWVVKGAYIRSNMLWLKHLGQWWPTEGPFLNMSAVGNHLFLLELLDFQSGEIFCFHDGNIFKMTGEYLKQRIKYQSRYTPFYSDLVCECVDFPEALAYATAFPGCFRRWPVNGHELFDAGLIDNQAVLGLETVVFQVNDYHLTKDSVWIFSNAGEAFPVPAYFGLRGAWSQVKLVPKLKIFDWLYRFTGTIAQQRLMDFIGNLLNNLVGITTLFFRTGSTPNDEPPWLTTQTFSDAKSVVYFPTMLSGMDRKDAICILLQGAQCSSHALLGEESQARNELKGKLLSLCKKHDNDSFIA